jgi:beta-mannosidase
VFEGLDTFATVRLNGGKPILEADNMFVEYRVNITKQLVEGENELSILFDSAWLRGKELEGTFTIW